MRNGLHRALNSVMLLLQAIRRIQAEYDRVQSRVDAMYVDKLDGRIDAGFFDRKVAGLPSWLSAVGAQVQSGLSSSTSTHSVSDGMSSASQLSKACCRST